MPIRITVLLAFLLFVCAEVDAQEQKIAINVTHTGEDAVGIRLAYSIREEIRRSDAYELETSDNSMFQISLISLDPVEDGENMTACSAAFIMRNFVPYEEGDPQTWKPIFLNHLLVTAGSNRVEDQAKYIVAQFDNELQKFWQEASRN